MVESRNVYECSYDDYANPSYIVHMITKQLYTGHNFLQKLLEIIFVVFCVLDRRYFISLNVFVSISGNEYCYLSN
jgi:hypothetical protein